MSCRQATPLPDRAVRQRVAQCRAVRHRAVQCRAERCRVERRRSMASGRAGLAPAIRLSGLPVRSVSTGEPMSRGPWGRFLGHLLHHRLGTTAEPCPGDLDDRPDGRYQPLASEARRTGATPLPRTTPLLRTRLPLRTRPPLGASGRQGTPRAEPLGPTPRASSTTKSRPPRMTPEAPGSIPRCEGPNLWTRRRSQAERDRRTRHRDHAPAWGPRPAP